MLVSVRNPHVIASPEKCKKSSITPPCPWLQRKLQFLPRTRKGNTITENDSFYEFLWRLPAITCICWIDAARSTHRCRKTDASRPENKFTQSVLPSGEGSWNMRWAAAREKLSPYARRWSGKRSLLENVMPMIRQEPMWARKSKSVELKFRSMVSLTAWRCLLPLNYQSSTCHLDPNNALAWWNGFAPSSLNTRRKRNSWISICHLRTECAVSSSRLLIVWTPRKPCNFASRAH